MTQFSELGLSSPILKALDDQGYTTPTPIQAQAIPAVLTGRDLLGIAQTGTGKTAAFALPILNHLARNRKSAQRKSCRVLVVTPTRELATQIGESFKVYGRHLGISVAVIFGGMPQRPQIRALNGGLDVLVATPGRLLDHVGQRNVVLGETEILVLDEADQMLDLGFVKPIRTIVSNLPKDRQTLFFSATMPKEISKLANEFLDRPAKVAVTPVASTVERITQRVIQIEAPKKRALLAELLAAGEMSRTIVFTRTKRGADRVAKHLEGTGIRAAAIHGNKSQRQREAALDAFRKGKTAVLVATDIAARGIDIDEISHVVNYELPEIPESYVHRIGRTARAGAEGQAISLVDGAELKLLRAIERLTRQSIPLEDRRNDAGLVAVKTNSPPQVGSRRHGQGADRSKSRNGQDTGHGERRAKRSSVGRKKAPKVAKTWSPNDSTRGAENAEGGRPTRSQMGERRAARNGEGAASESTRAARNGAPSSGQRAGGNGRVKDARPNGARKGKGSGFSRNAQKGAGPNNRNRTKSRSAQSSTTA